MGVSAGGVKVMVHSTGRTSVEGALSKIDIVDVPTSRQRFDEAPEAADRPAQSPHTLVTAVTLAIEQLLATRAQSATDLSATAAAAGTIGELADIVAPTLAQLVATRWCAGCRAEWGIHASAAAEALDTPADRRVPVGPARCVRWGRRWKFDVGHRSVVVEHSVGMLHLAVLIANPGAEIHAVDLVAGVEALNHRVAATASTQSVLDAVAQRQYRRRLARLDTDIAQAPTGDRASVARIRGERDWLTAQLTAHTGVGGRPRAFTDNAERARLAVGKAIRRSIARIGAADSLVGEHLRERVHTGMRCSYLFPEHRTG